MLVQDFEIETLSAYKKLIKSPLSKIFSEIEPTSITLFLADEQNIFAFICTLIWLDEEFCFSF